MRYLILSAILLVGMIACSENKTTLKETHNVDGQDFTIRVTTFPTQKALQDFLDDNEYTSESVDGLARWIISKDMKNLKRCDIYVVKPKRAREHNIMETWGHELVHCVYGSFHMDGVR